MNKGFFSEVQNFITKHKRAINSRMDWQSFYILIYRIGILAQISLFLALYLPPIWSHYNGSCNTTNHSAN